MHMNCFHTDGAGSVSETQIPEDNVTENNASDIGKCSFLHFPPKSVNFQSVCRDGEPILVRKLHTTTFFPEDDSEKGKVEVEEEVHVHSHTGHDDELGEVDHDRDKGQSFQKSTVEKLEATDDTFESVEKSAGKNIVIISQDSFCPQLSLSLCVRNFFSNFFTLCRDINRS